MACCLLLAGCAPSQSDNAGVYMLIDTSGTYREEIQKAEQIIRYTLSRLDATDSFAVARIDTGSFSEKDIVAKITFDDRPSTINRQKRLFAEQVQTFVDTARSSPFTDITGGMLQAVEFLNEKGYRIRTGRIRHHRTECNQAALGQRRPARVPDTAGRVAGQGREVRRYLARHQ
jgi:hypothetical protein